RLLAVNQSAGGGPVLLNAIAAAVIGGTSLFGGRGSMCAALLGTMVIQSISNGMDLLSLSSGIKFMVTGGVLLVTVTIDSVVRRSRAAAARWRRLDRVDELEQQRLADRVERRERVARREALAVMGEDGGPH